MDVRVDLAGPVAIVTVSGECDASEAPRLAAALREARMIASEVHLEMGSLEFLDSAALEVLHRASVELEANGSPLVLIDPRPGIRRVLQIAGLEGRLQIRGATSSASHSHGESAPPEPVFSPAPNTV